MNRPIDVGRLQSRKLIAGLSCSKIDSRFGRWF